jgi:hypothetical protein
VRVYFRTVPQGSCENATQLRAVQKNGLHRNEVMVMKPFRFFLTLAVAAGTLAVSTPGAFAQSSNEEEAQASARITAACQVVAEATRVQETLDRFDSGLAAHDVDQLQAAGIEPVSAKGWQRFFKSNPEAKVTDSCPVTSLFIGGDKAIWNCMETSTISSQGKAMQYAHLVQFTFTKRDGAWMISERK